MTDPVGEAIDLFKHTLDKTALVWFQMNRSKFKDLTTLKMMFLQRYNPWGKTKREQLQSWNILSFDPKNTDVDEHIDLINTLGDMVDQKEEAKKENANTYSCKLLFAGFLILKLALVWGMVVRGLHVEIFVRVLCSSRVNLNNVNNTNVFCCV